MLVFHPHVGDANLSDGRPHGPDAWAKLDLELYVRFEGGTQAPDLYRGCYRDPDTGQRVDDESSRFIVAVPESKLDELRAVLVEACEWFQQKCIYLSVAGYVEFLKKP
jgi:hypothetical protein